MSPARATQLARRSWAGGRKAPAPFLLRCSPGGLRRAVGRALVRRMSRSGPDFSHERRAIAAGARIVAGVDEAGRGPLAGPVIAAAVVLDPARIPDGLDDSKRLSAPRRVALERELREVAWVGIGEASVAEIDRLNVLRATMLAMVRAVAALPVAPDHLLVDGTHLPDGLSQKAEAVVKGDGRCLSIAAASILAKVVRDAIMADLARLHPEYGWERNAGYGTEAHMVALKRHGVSPYHRRSFAPVHKILCQENFPTD